jgi:glycosyltransferase involved in cell wall biosynthesis
LRGYRITITLGEVLFHTKPKRSVVIYLGIDTERFTLGSERFTLGSERQYILTIARQGGRLLKGIDRFLKLASLLPSKSFVIAGPICRDRLAVKDAPPNVKLLGELDQDELAALYQRTRVYCQLSRYEAFGVPVAEAMACGCLPVVSDSGALPEVVDGCGVIVPGGDVVRAAESIETIWNDVESSQERRARVIEEFPISRRESSLRQLLLTITRS